MTVAILFALTCSQASAQTLPVVKAPKKISITKATPISLTKVSLQTPLIEETPDFVSKVFSLTLPEELKPVARSEMSSSEEEILRSYQSLWIDREPDQALLRLARHLAPKSDFYRGARLSLLHVLAAKNLPRSAEQVAYEILDDKKDPHRELAVEFLIENTKKGDVSRIRELVKRGFSDWFRESKNQQFSLTLALYHFEEGDFEHTAAILQGVTDAKLAADRDHLLALIEYRAGKPTEALQLITQSQKQEPSSDKALLKARLEFQLNQYAEALNSYLQVDKAHPEWTEAMVERGWAQIMMQDYEGASGNMFSLHSDFFKHAFAPESYTARTVGYLNLCQFGDAIKSMENLDRKYRPMSSKMQQRLALGKVSLLQDVRTFFAAREQATINGLPRELFWNLARDFDFIRSQTLINQMATEKETLDKSLLEMLQLEKNLLREMTEINETLLRIKSTESSRAEQLEQDLAQKKNKLQLVKEGRTHLRPVLDRLHEQRRVFVLQTEQQMEKNLQKRFASFQQRLTHLFEQSEILAFEIFTAAGDHLRLQNSGAPIIDPKEFVAVKSTQAGKMRWQYKGEVWEDEIGHYRSSLKNVCGGDIAQGGSK